MKIDINLVLEMLDEAKTDSLKEVDESQMMADYGGKMFNYGVRHMFHEMWTKLYEAERVAQGVSE